MKEYIKCIMKQTENGNFIINENLNVFDETILKHLNLILQSLKFDIVLLDAPCTGTGTFRKNPDVVWVKNKNDVTLVASNKQYEIPYGVCQINKRGSLHQLIEKPKHDYLVNAGLYIMSPKVLNLIPKNKFFNINNLLNSIKSRKMKVGVYPISEESWSDVGQWSEYNKFFKSSK